MTRALNSRASKEMRAEKSIHDSRETALSKTALELCTTATRGRGAKPCHKKRTIR